MYNILNEILKIQQQYPNIYIGGSIALILQKVIPYRKPKDIDLISPDRIHIYEIFSIDKEKHWRIRNKTINNIRFEIFHNPNAEYIKYKYKGNVIKLSPTDEIMEWKINQLLEHSESKNIFKKHLIDLQYHK
jgi:hypothetical protein